MHPWHAVKSQSPAIQHRDFAPEGSLGRSGSSGVNMNWVTRTSIVVLDGAHIPETGDILKQLQALGITHQPLHAPLHKTELLGIAGAGKPGKANTVGVISVGAGEQVIVQVETEKRISPIGQQAEPSGSRYRPSQTGWTRAPPRRRVVSPSAHCLHSRVSIFLSHQFRHGPMINRIQLFSRRYGHTQIAHQTIVQTVDPAVD